MVEPAVNEGSHISAGAPEAPTPQPGAPADASNAQPLDGHSLSRQTRPGEWLCLLLVALVALAALARYACSPDDAAAHLLDPDGVEYVAAAQRFAAGFGLNIDVAGVAYPSRYPPVLSILLSGIYRLAPGHLGNGIYFITALAIVGAISAYGIGRELAGSRLAGIGAALALLAQPTLTAIHRGIQSDGPTLSLLLLGIWLFMRYAKGLSGWPVISTAGVAIGIAAGMRPLAGFSVVVLVAITAMWQRLVPAIHTDRARARWGFTFLALVPVMLIASKTAAFQHRFFGSSFRTGYAYWMPLPYEWLDQTFSIRYLAINWHWTGPTLLTALAAVALGIAILSFTCGKRAILAAIALVVIAAPVTLAHLVYCWPDYRFHALLLAVGMIVGGAGLGAFAHRFLARHEARLAPAVCVAGVVAFLVLSRPSMPPNASWFICQEIVARTPADAVIVTDANPALFAQVCGSRTQIVATRRAEYASKLIAPLPLGDRPAGLTWPGSHRDPRLRALGAVEAVPVVALEQPAAITRALHSGKLVFAIQQDLPPELGQQLQQSYQLAKPAPGLIEIRRR